MSNNISTFIRLRKPRKIHYRVKLHQSNTDAFQDVGSFSLKVESGGHMSPKSNGFLGRHNT